MGDKQDERRKEILEAALKAFGDKGYDKTSMDEVVRATGLSKGTIYWYFKNKQEMFTALMEYVIDGIFAELDTVFDTAQKMPPRAGLRMILQATEGLFDMNPKGATLTVDFMLQAMHSPEMLQKYAGYYARYIDELAGLIQRGIDVGEFRPVNPHAASAALVGLLDGIGLQAMLADEMTLGWEWQLKAILEAVDAMLLHGLMKGRDDE